MALWQIINRKSNTLPEQWDDGDTSKPGEAGFSTDKVTAFAGAKNFNYTGTPNWAPPVSQEA